MVYKVLIVDDNKLARMAVIKTLSRLQPDWIQLEAANAEEAVKSLKLSLPNIVLTDFNMPGRDGIDLASEIHQSVPNVPVAVISANNQRAVVDRAEAIGATFIAKPLTEAALCEFLKVAVQRLVRQQATLNSSKSSQ